MSRVDWRLAAGLVDDRSEQVIGLTAAVSAGGDHGNDGDRDFGIEAGEGIAQGDGVLVVPQAPKECFDFSGLSGAVPDGGDERGRGGFEDSLGLSGELAAE